MLGVHSALSVLGRSSAARCARKAGLAYINIKEYAKATAVVRRADEKMEDAGSNYLVFVCSVEQGFEDEGAICLRILKCQTCSTL
jgi:hypothetical protein